MTGSTFSPESDDARLREAIGHTFEALADQITETELDEVLPHMHRRIATRRRLRAASVGAGALALVGAVAVTAWATPWRDGAEPVQPAQPTSAVPSTSAPTETPTKTETPTQTPTGTGMVLDDPRFAAGRPLPYSNWDDPEGWVCGASIDDLLARTTSDRFRLEIVSDVDLSRGVARATAAARITNVSGEDFSGDAEGVPLLLWTQAGRIVEGHFWVEGGSHWQPLEAWDVDLGYNDPEVPPIASVPPGGSFETMAHLISDGGWHCGTRVSSDEAVTGYTYPDDLPSGQYEVYAITWYELSSVWSYVASDPVTVTVP